MVSPKLTKEAMRETLNEAGVDSKQTETNEVARIT